jgi:hypothetical protein
MNDMQTHLPVEPRCARCGETPPPPLELRTCPRCTFLLCTRCLVLHDLQRVAARRMVRPFLCDLVEEYAALHCLYRREQEFYALGQEPPSPEWWTPEAIDWQAARQAFASSVRKGGRQ